MLASALALLLVAALTLTSMLDDDGQSAGSDDASQRAAAPVPSETAPASGDGVAGDPPPTPEQATSAGPSTAPDGGDEGDATESANNGSDDAGDDTGADGVLPVLDDVDVPGDWVELEPDGAPYRLRHPPGWRVVRVSDTLTDIRDPNSSTYLRLDWVDEKRDPVGAWEQLEPGFAARHDDYRNLGITSTTYKGDNAALWEYRYRSGGRRLHAYNLGVNADDYGFALNMQTSQENWNDAQQLWAQFLASYEFTGP